MKRALSPSLNPAGLTSAGLAIYAATVMILNVYHGHGVIDPPVIVAAVAAVAALLTRQAVTPVRDPRDGNGMPLLKYKVVVPDLPSSNVTVTTTPPAPTSPPAGTGNVTLKPPAGLT